MAKIEQSKLANEIRQMQSQQFLPDGEYYAITFVADDTGKIQTSVYSAWAGFTESSPKREIRQAALVIPERMRSLYDEIGERCLVVNTKPQLAVFLNFGGHGIIEASIARKYLKGLLEPTTCLTSFTKGFLIETSLPRALTNHAPTPKLRMQVLKRDNFRCKICGESASNNVHIVLHVHHIVPWAMGGVTEADNLITLCHTCHSGLDPHYFAPLFDLLGLNRLQDSIRNSVDYVSGMRNFNKVMAEKLAKKAKVKKKSKS